MLSTGSRFPPDHSHMEIDNKKYTLKVIFFCIKQHLILEVEVGANFRFLDCWVA